MLRKFKKEVFGGAASCLQSLGFKTKRDHGQETSGFRHSIFFGALANNIKQSGTAPKKDFKQWLYPSPGVSKLDTFFQCLSSLLVFFTNKLLAIIGVANHYFYHVWTRDRAETLNLWYNAIKSSFWTNELSKTQMMFASEASGASFIDSQRRPGQGCAGFSLVFFKQDRANSEPEAARPLLLERNVAVENRMESKRGGPINIFKKN